MSVLRIGARRSPLAVVQAEWVATQLAARGIEVEQVGVVSQGDVDRRRLTDIGGTGVFAAAVRDALLSGHIDLAVHSLKDLPVAPFPELAVVAVPQREDARDVLVGLDVHEWTDDTVIGTGSPRRQAQLHLLAAERGVTPQFVAVRGNVETRLGLVRDARVHTTVLAAAGLRRLGILTDGSRDLLGVPFRVLGFDELLPAAGQGALALECRADSRWLPEIRTLQHDPSRAAVDAERRFLAVLEAGCLSPVGVHAVVDADSRLTLAATTAKKSGSRTLSGDAAHASDLGAELARAMLAELPDTERKPG